MKGRTIILGPYPPPYGGVAIFNQALLKHLAKHDPVAWVYGPNTPPYPGAELCTARSRVLAKLVCRYGARAAVVDSSAFFMEYPTSFRCLSAWLALKSAFRFRWIKVLHDATFPRRYDEFSPAMIRVCRCSARWVDEFVVVNDRLREWLISKFRVRQRISTIPSLLPMVDPVPDKMVLGEYERSLQSYDRSVCSIGAFVPAYGFAEIAEAVGRLRDKTSMNIGLLLISGGFSEEENHKRRVVQDRPWIHVAEDVPHPTVLGILKRCDVFVRPFAHESYGISRVEALLCGTPVVATDVGETRGMLLYDRGDIDQLTAQVARAIFDPSAAAVEKWALFYREQAYANLQQWCRIIGC